MDFCESDGDICIKGWGFKLTCWACPEQYDVYKGGKEVGYVRFRHSRFSVDYLDDGYHENLHTQYLDDQDRGRFKDDKERMEKLQQAIELLTERMKKERK